MYSCWTKIFQKRDNICRWFGLTPLASAFILIDESSTYDQAMESFKKCPPLPCFFNGSCTDSFSCLLCDNSRHWSCYSAFLVLFLHGDTLCPPSSSSQQYTPWRSRQPFQLQVFNLFFLPHNSLFFFFSSGFTLPDNGFQRIHSKFPIFNIRFSSLGNTMSLPTQGLGIDCTSRVASRSEGIITYEPSSGEQLAGDEEQQDDPSTCTAITKGHWEWSRITCLWTICMAHICIWDAQPGLPFWSRIHCSHRFRLWFL